MGAGHPPAPDTDELADTVGSALGRAARPRLVHPVAELPMLESGKLDRTALAELARDALAHAELGRTGQAPDPHDSRPPRSARGRIPG